MDYNTQQELQDYFDQRLFTDPWDFATSIERTKASAQATNTINIFNYIGSKEDPAQDNAFPLIIVRNDPVTCLPITVIISDADAKIAHAEETLALLSGINPELEINNISKSSNAFASIRNSRDTSFVLDHIRAGFASNKAFALMKKYIIVNNPIKLVRV